MFFFIGPNNFYKVIFVSAPIESWNIRQYGDLRNSFSRHGDQSSCRLERCDDCHFE